MFLGLSGLPVFVLAMGFVLGQVLEKWASHGDSVGSFVGINTCEDMRERGLNKEEVQVLYDYTRVSTSPTGSSGAEQIL